MSESLSSPMEVFWQELALSATDFVRAKPEGYWLMKPLYLSINRRLINKNDLRNVDAFVSGFERTEVTASQLADLVKQGFAYAPVFKADQRRTSNFVASSVLSLDVDGEVNLSAISEDPVVREGATVVYTTASHSSERPRFRIVFALEEPICDPQQFKAAKQALALRLFGDQSVVDPARLFYGNSQAEIKAFDRGLSLKTVEELVAQRLEAVRMERHEAVGTVASKLAIGDDQFIRTAHMGEMALQEIDPPAAVYCPHHPDENPSAFVVVSRTGQRGIHCSRCAQTFWPCPTSTELPLFDLAARNTLEFSIKHEERPFAEFEREMLADGTFKHDDSYRDMLPNLHRARVHILKDRYLDLSHVHLSGVTYIKSPKGTGKTAALARLLEDPKLKVLVVGHRKALLRQLANRLNLTYYISGGSKEEAGSKEELGSKERFAVSLDSISKAPLTIGYDYVVIDESEQVLAHFLSDTMVERRRQAMFRLQLFAKKAKHVIALDADLGWPTFRFLSRCKGHNEATILLNDVKQRQGTVNVFTNKVQLTEILFDHIKAGQKCYVTSNRKSIVDALHNLIKRDFPLLRTITITSDNSMSEEAQHLLINPKVAAQFDVILTSPSVSTGVDFSFEEEKALFHVFGFFEPLTLTHFECDQQLSRIRAPLASNVYMSRKQFSFETDLEVVRRDLLEARLGDSCITGFSETGVAQYDPEDPLLDLAGSVETIRRSSVNCLLENFIGYKEAEGWTIEHIEPPEYNPDSSNILKLGHELAQAEYTRALLSAQPTSQEEAEKIGKEIDGNKHITYDKMRSYRRFQIESFYRVPISADLIELDDRGRTRQKVVLFERITDPAYFQVCRQAFERESIDLESIKLLKNRRYKAVLLVKVLEVTGLANEGELCVKTDIQQSKLFEFIKFVSMYKAVLETVFNNPIRKDYRKKAIACLNDILEDAGLEVTLKKTDANGGVKRYIYGLDYRIIEAMKEISSRRSSKSFSTDSLLAPQKASSHSFG